MQLRTFLATALFAALVSTAPVSAQEQTQQSPSLSVNPGVLTQGGSAKINYSNPSMAGQTVHVAIDNGMGRTPQFDGVEIQLDAAGQGSTTWTVPQNWLGANFNAPGVDEVVCPIVL